jgi:hypothetical protein
MYGLDSSGSGWGLVAGFCRHYNELQIVQQIRLLTILQILVLLFFR